MCDTASPIGGRRFPGMNAQDTALLKVQEAVAAATALELGPGLILDRVANGLTGRLNGPVERAASRAMTEAYRVVAATPVEEIRTA